MYTTGSLRNWSMNYFYRFIKEEKMAYFEFPHTRTYDSDLGWIINHVKDNMNHIAVLQSWAATHEEEYEALAKKVGQLVDDLIDVISPWDSSKEYDIFDIVEYQGTNYIALQDVPVGVMITNTDYWQPANIVQDQINAIGTVVSNMQENWCVVKTFAEMDGTTADRVIVLNDDGYYGSGDTVAFIKSPNALAEHNNSAYQRANGDWMMPEPSYDSVTPNAPMQQIGDVIASYTSRTDLVADQYADTNPFNMDLEPGSMTGIDCSTLATLVTRGITYNNSRYVAGNEQMMLGQYAGNNIPRNIKTTRPGIENKEQYNCAEMALYYAEQNRLFYVDYEKEHPVAQLAPGDLLFSSDVEVQPNRYLYLHHVVVVLAVYPDSDLMLVAQAGGSGYKMAVSASSPTYGAASVGFKTLTAENIDMYRVYARPNYSTAGDAAHSISIVRLEGEKQTPTAGNRTFLAGIYLKEKMRKDGLYTIAIKGKLPGAASKAYIAIQYVFASGSGESSFYQNFNNIVYTGQEQLNVVIPAPRMAEYITEIDLYARVPGSAESVTPENVEITECSIYNTAAPDVVAGGSSDNDVLTGAASYVSNVSESRVYNESGSQFLQLTFNVGSAQNGATTLGTLDPAKICALPYSRSIVAVNNTTKEVTGGIIAANTNVITIGALPSTGYWRINTSI